MPNQKRVAIRACLTRWLKETQQVGDATQMDAVSFCIGYYEVVTLDHVMVIRAMVKDGLLRV